MLELQKVSPGLLIAFVGTDSKLTITSEEAKESSLSPTSQDLEKQKGFYSFNSLGLAVDNFPVGTCQTKLLELSAVCFIPP